jgi:hypothetical protein
MIDFQICKTIYCSDFVLLSIYFSYLQHTDSLCHKLTRFDSVCHAYGWASIIIFQNLLRCNIGAAVFRDRVSI